MSNFLREVVVKSVDGFIVKCNEIVVQNNDMKFIVVVNIVYILDFLSWYLLIDGWFDKKEYIQWLKNIGREFEGQWCVYMLFV